MAAARGDRAQGAAIEIRDRLDMVLTDVMIAAAARSAAAKGAAATGALIGATVT